MARRAPRIDSKLRLINSGRAWVSTWIVTSSGTSRCSISSRINPKSVSDAAGKPTSISLKPSLTNSSNIRRLRSGPIGSTKRLVPVAQVDAAPQRRAVDDLRRPAPVGQIDGRKGTVFVDRHAGHRKLLVAGSPPNVAVPLLKSGMDRGRLASKPPTGAKSATETRLCIRRENGRKRENVVQIEKRHQHQRAREFPSWDGQRRRLGVPQDAEQLSRSS